MEQTKDNLTPQETPQNPEGQPVESPEGQTQTEVQAPVADNQSQILELQQKLTELSNENAALNQRFNEVGGQQQQPQAPQQPQYDDNYVIAMQKAAEGEAEEAAKYIEKARQAEQNNVIQQVGRMVDTNYLLRQKEEQILAENTPSIL